MEEFGDLDQALACGDDLVGLVDFGNELGLNIDDNQGGLSRIEEKSGAWWQSLEFGHGDFVS